MDAIFEAHAGQVAPIRPHVSWPLPSDPFYLANTLDSNARVSYYGVGYVPTFRFEGMFLKDPSNFLTYAQWYAYVESTLDSLYNVPRPEFRINFSQYVDGAWIRTNFDIIAEQGVSGDYRITMAVVEDSAYSGPNLFRFVMRDYVPNAYGMLATMTTGDSLHYEWPYRNTSGATDITTMVFVQRVSDNQILQAISVPPFGTTTGIGSGEAPLRVVLAPNAPNPFNPATTIGYTLDRARPVRLAVYDQAGRLVSELVRGAGEPGSHTAVWDGRDRFGHEVGSGVYFYRLDAGPLSETRKMTLIR
ncbi:MAG: FlgD immunoglobulin-like domain containing protein [Candidatus Eisenbacteria bacterium]